MLSSSMALPNLPVVANSTRSAANYHLSPRLRGGVVVLAVLAAFALVVLEVFAQDRLGWPAHAVHHLCVLRSHCDPNVVSPPDLVALDAARNALFIPDQELYSVLRIELLVLLVHPLNRRPVKEKVPLWVHGLASAAMKPKPFFGSNHRTKPVAVPPIMGSVRRPTMGSVRPGINGTAVFSAMKGKPVP